jgi:hypothetical protein
MMLATYKEVYFEILLLCSSEKEARLVVVIFLCDRYGLLSFLRISNQEQIHAFDAFYPPMLIEKE